jgi:hypothetical protein
MIANTIIQQLGNIALSMLGAHMLIDLGDGLQFRFRGCKKSNLIQVILDPCDTYTLRFWKVTITRKKPSKEVSYDLTECQLVSSHSGIYCDMLHDTIEQETGLFARF